MDLKARLQQRIGDPRAIQFGGKSQGISQREMDKLVCGGGQWAGVAWSIAEPVMPAICDVLCIYAAVGADGVLPDGVGELWGIYGDDARSRRG